ncbi:RHS repeat-associated core domain-containing protein [Rheinheimera salexigens]|nr:RHS repeat-associated core domain-containing protein [Rheinheimera salexigens]
MNSNGVATVVGVALNFVPYCQGWFSALFSAQRTYSNGTVTVLQQFIYDPWGKQYSVSTNSLFTTYSNPGTSKGYTGHNMVNDFEVIHMNGRTYNPHLGRFMQADPFVQAPGNLQNYNRYSYVLNNPMSYTDPSGYFFKKLGNFVKQYWRVIAAIAVTYFTAGAASGWAAAWGFSGAAAGAVTGAIAGAAGGFVATGSLKGALVGAISGAAFGAIGASGWNDVGKFAATGAVGGISSDLQGGKFGHGFWSAGLGSAAGGQYNSNAPSQVIVSAVIGGTISKLTGSKFANGAFTAAFASALRADWGETKASVGHTAGSGDDENTIVENRKALQSELDKLAANGTLSKKHSFDTVDAAAKEVLNATAPLSKKYGLEVGGNIYQDGGKYHYTMPIIGDGISVSVPTSWIGYHTHPSGGMYFSNSFATAGGGNDALWVQKSGNPLYMGVQLSSGSVGIAVCEPRSCPNIGRFGTTGRIVQ